MLPDECLIILDVGHGNAALVRTGRKNILIDAGLGAATLQFLKSEEITHLDLVLVSHADSDHVAGLLGILAEDGFTIDTIHVNSDGAQTSKNWDDLLYELNAKSADQAINVELSLTIGGRDRFLFGKVWIEVLAPTVYIAGKSPGAVTRDHEPITTNTISAVLRINVEDHKVALLAGDVDEVGWRHMLALPCEPKADILIFPHHGGAPGSRHAEAFTRSLMESVRPELVIFSNGRGKFDLPRKNVVDAIRSVSPAVRIACTQLSKLCAQVVAEPPSQAHLVGTFSQGRQRNACCAGTMVITFGESSSSISPTNADHFQFVKRNAPTALCMPQAR